MFIDVVAIPKFQNSRPLMYACLLEIGAGTTWNIIFYAWVQQGRTFSVQTKTRILVYDRTSFLVGPLPTT